MWVLVRQFRIYIIINIGQIKYNIINSTVLYWKASLFNKNYEMATNPNK